MVTVNERAEHPGQQAASERPEHAEQDDLGPPVSLQRQQVRLSDATHDLKESETFEALNLKSELLRGVHSMNWTMPSPIQSKALPHLLVENPQNLIAQAPAGTGKTAAFVLAVLNRVDAAQAVPQAIVICPTRELAKQNADVTIALAKFTDITVFTCLPDTAATARTVTSHVIIGTPGSLMKLIRNKVLNVNSIRSCVVDEADEMIKMNEVTGPTGSNVAGLGVDTSKIVSYLRSCHIMLFSATFPPKVRDYAMKMASPNPFKITVSMKNLTLPHIKHFEIKCPTEAFKFDIMCALFKIMNVGQSIIFVNKRYQATDLFMKLEAKGYKASLIHGEVSVQDRDTVINQFRALETSVLVTTDLLNRGFDVPEVSCVVNYDIPMIRGVSHHESYYHRTGRSGRFGRPGIAINLICSAADESSFQEIKDAFSISPIEVTARTEEELFNFLEPFIKDVDNEIGLQSDAPTSA
uniref:RNA helicase n=1 Tax=Spongospora subterranea TaxID=70186 RepID=A0A0H5R523_9EUKA|eukprot:CRZ08986.1 hypothetical protein [Spongospora subterranea]